MQIGFESMVVDQNDDEKVILKKISENAKGIVFVIDDCKRLVGSITDGDCRRYVLREKSSTYLASDVMNRNVFSLPKSKEYMSEEYMRERQITSIPVLNEQGCIEAIHYFDGAKLYFCEKLPVSAVMLDSAKYDSQMLASIGMGVHTDFRCVAEGLAAEGIPNLWVIHGQTDVGIDKISYTSSEGEIKYLNSEVYLGDIGTIRQFSSLFSDYTLLLPRVVLKDVPYGKILEFHKNRDALITVVCSEKTFKTPKWTISLDKQNHMKGYMDQSLYSYLVETGYYIVSKSFWNEIENNAYCDLHGVIMNFINCGKRVEVYTL